MSTDLEPKNDMTLSADRMNANIADRAVQRV